MTKKANKWKRDSMEILGKTNDMNLGLITDTDYHVEIKALVHFMKFMKNSKMDVFLKNQRIVRYGKRSEEVVCL